MMKIIGDVEKSHSLLKQKYILGMRGNVTEKTLFAMGKIDRNGWFDAAFLSVTSQSLLVWPSVPSPPSSPPFLLVFAFYVLHSFFLTVKHCIGGFLFLIYRSYLFYYFCRKLFILIVFLYFQSFFICVPWMFILLPKSMTVEEKKNT